MNNLNCVCQRFSHSSPYWRASSSHETNNNATQNIALFEKELLKKNLLEWVEVEGRRMPGVPTCHKKNPCHGDMHWERANATANRIWNCKQEPNDYLSLPGSFLGSLPSAFFTLTFLESVFLNGNQLEVLPEEISLLTNLKILKISFNSLRYLPPSIGKLKNLWELELVRNQLETVPSEIGCLENLRILDLKGNPLKTLPSEMARLTELTGFKVSQGDLIDEDKLAQLEKDGVITSPRPAGFTVNNIEIFIKNTRGYVDVDELFGDIKNADTKS